MAIEIDTSRELRGINDLQALVAAAFAAHEHDESDWLEWKLNLDLSTKEGCFAIARNVLGMANRQPERAAIHCGGLGFVVVGLEPGMLSGITSVDPAVSEYAVAYLSVWAAFGAVVFVVADRIPDLGGWMVLGVVLAVAAGWQLTARKRRWLRDCHRSSLLPMRGWQAHVGALRFGFRNGFACLGSCWCLMMIMVVAPGSMFLWMLPLRVITSTERLSERPRRVTRTSALVLAVGAIGALTAAAV